MISIMQKNFLPMVIIRQPQAFLILFLVRTIKTMSFGTFAALFLSGLKIIIMHTSALSTRFFQKKIFNTTKLTAWHIWRSLTSRMLSIGLSQGLAKNKMLNFMYSFPSVI